MTPLHERLADLPEGDIRARDAVHERAADILRPSGALRWLDEIAAWLEKTRGFWSKRLDALERALEAEAAKDKRK